MLLSRLHNVSSFTSDDCSIVKYNAASNRIVATDGSVVVAVPVDGKGLKDFVCEGDILKKQAGTLAKGKTIQVKESDGKLSVGNSKVSTKIDVKNFPAVEGMFPESKPQLVVGINPEDMIRICQYAIDHRVEDESLYLALCHDVPSADTHGLERMTQNPMFFFRAEGAESTVLVSGIVVCEQFDKGPQCEKIVAITEGARRPKVGAPKDMRMPDFRADHFAKSLKQLGWGVFEPGKMPVADVKRDYNPDSINAIQDLCDSVMAGDLRQFDELLSLGVNYERLDQDDNHVLVYAACECPKDVLHYVASKCPKLINRADGYGWYPVLYAACNNRLDNISILKEFGADTSIEVGGRSMADVAKEFGANPKSIALLSTSKPKAAAKKPSRQVAAKA